MDDDNTAKIELEIPTKTTFIKDVVEVLKTGKTLEVEMYDYKRDGEKQKKFLFRMRLI